MKHLKIMLTSLVFLFSVTAAATPLDLEKYVEQSIIDNETNTGRCVNDPIPRNECNAVIDWAVQNEYITKRAGDWGKANGYFPVVDFFFKKVMAVCRCGCFEQNTLIRVSDGVYTFDLAAKDVARSHGVIALSSDASLSNMSTETFDIISKTAGEEIAQLYVFSFDDGSELKVTQHHGMLLGDGSMTAAKDVAVADTMIRADGSVISVTEITRESTDADVYNFETSGAEAVNHIIVANDIFVGDLVWQNQMQADLGKVVVRQ